MSKRRPTRADFKPPLKRPAVDSLENTSVSILGKQSRGASSKVEEKLETVADLQSKVADLRERNRQLDEEILTLRQKGFDESQLKDFIDKLHKYNSIKDLAQSLLGQLAIRQGVTTKSLYPKFDLDLDD